MINSVVEIYVGSQTVYFTSNKYITTKNGKDIVTAGVEMKETLVPVNKGEYSREDLDKLAVPGKAVTIVFENEESIDTMVRMLDNCRKVLRDAQSKQEDPNTPTP